MPLLRLAAAAAAVVLASRLDGAAGAGNQRGALLDSGEAIRCGRQSAPPRCIALRAYRLQSGQQRPGVSVLYTGAEPKLLLRPSTHVYGCLSARYVRILKPLSHLLTRCREADL